MKKFAGIILMAALCLAPRFSHSAIYILIDQPEDQRFPIAIPNIVKGDGFRGSSSILKTIPEVIRKDLELSGYFFVISPKIYKDHSATLTSGDIPFGSWTAIGARGIVKGVATTEGGRTTIQLRLFDANTKEMQMGKQYTFDREDWRIIAHRFADEIMQATTGRRGPFATQIAYTVQTSKNKKKGWKQIYVMDADGHEPRRLTKDRSYNLGPSWSPDGQHITFASYVGGFPDIYTLDLKTGQRHRLTSNRSTNITPRFSPDGSLIAYSSGQGRDMELYLMNNIGGNNRSFSPAFGVDIAPAFSPDGSELVFASERGGRLHLYRMDLSSTGNARRITFAGAYNDSPDWSPDGTRIVFARYSGGVYNVYTVYPDGSNPRRITSFGSNEHPRWAPDSRYIVYSSTVNKKSQIYMMRLDGAHKTMLTNGKDASLPDWGPWPADYWE